MASNHTAHFGLNQWAATDPVLREDFNEDNQKIEEALSAPPLYGKIREVVTTEAATQVEFDLSDLDLDTYRVLEFDLTIPGGDTIITLENARLRLYFNDTDTILQSCFNSRGNYSDSISDSVVSEDLATPYQVGMPPTQIHLTLYPAPAGTLADSNGRTAFRAMGGTSHATFFDDNSNVATFHEYGFRVYAPTLEKLVLKKKTTVTKLPVGTTLQIYGVRV